MVPAAGRLLGIGNWEDRKHLMQDRGGGRLENDNFSPDEQQMIKYMQERPDTYWGEQQHDHLTGNVL